MLPFNASLSHVICSLTQVCRGGYIRDGAEYRKHSNLGQFTLWFQRQIDNQTDAAIQDKENIIFGQTEQISADIINTQLSHGSYSCVIYFGDTHFSISQSADQSSTIAIRDLNTNKIELFHGVSFLELKKCVLKQFIREQRQNGNHSIDLCRFDLTGIDLNDIDFYFSVLSKENFEALITFGGSLTGTTLAKGTDLSSIDMHGKRLLGQLNHEFARSLILAGLDMNSKIWMWFLQTAWQHKHNCLMPDILYAKDSCRIQVGGKKFSIKNLDGCTLELFSDQHQKTCLISMPWAKLKAWMLTQHIERSNGDQEIDLSSFDLSAMDIKEISFANTVLSRANFDAIVAAGGSLAGAQLHTNADVTQLQLERLMFDKAMAKSLIRAGMEVDYVLANYFATKSVRGGHIHKAELLQDYLTAKRTEENLIDLSGFDLWDVACKEISFEGTVLSRDNLQAIIANNGDLSHARLADDVTNPVIYAMDFFALDKAMAIQLIAAGANTRTVLLHYVNTQRLLGCTNIDIQGIDRSNVPQESFNWDGVNLDGVKFANVQQSKMDENAVQAAFAQDLLTLLNIYSQAVRSVIKHSVSLDLVVLDQAEQGIKISQREINSVKLHAPHHARAVRYVHRQDDTSLDLVKAVIKTSTGNCREMAIICKSMMDCYLRNSLELLGYYGVSLKTFVCSAESPADHGFAGLHCQFQGCTREYLIDSWSEEGQAWPIEAGIEYFRTCFSNRYIPSPQDFRFSVDKFESDRFEQSSYLAGVSAIFSRAGVKEQLETALRKHRSDFVGLPALKCIG